MLHIVTGSIKILKVVNPKAKLRAEVELDLTDDRGEGLLHLTGLKVYQGTRGLFLAFPGAMEGKDYRQAYYPVSKRLRDNMEDAVLVVYTLVDRFGSEPFDRIHMVELLPQLQSDHAVAYISALLREEVA